MKSSRGISLISVIFAASAGLANAQTIRPACASQPSLTTPDAGTVTGCEHLRRFLDSIESVGVVASPAATAAFSQLFTSHAGFGNDAIGYGHHYLVNEAGDLSGKVFGKLVLPAMFRQDDVYMPIRSQPFGRRIGHVLKHVFVTNSADHSRNVFNVAAIPNSLLVAGLSNAYQPKGQRSLADTATRAGYNLGGFLLGDAYEEFLRPPVDKLKQQIKDLFSGHPPQTSKGAGGIR
jgi:hypothetical protein